MKTLSPRHKLFQFAITNCFFAIIACGTEGGNPHRKEVTTEVVGEGTPPNSTDEGPGKNDPMNPGTNTGAPVQGPSVGKGGTSGPNLNCVLQITEWPDGNNGTSGFETLVDVSDSSSFEGTVPESSWQSSITLSWLSATNGVNLPEETSTPQAGNWKIIYSSVHPTNESLSFTCEGLFTLSETISSQSSIQIKIVGSSLL